MDHLWSPWRYQYLQQAPEPGQGCIFCRKAAEHRDAENYIVHRARNNFVILNLYPYTTGHLMVIPYEHVATLAQAQPDTLAEMMELTRKAECALASVYKPHGFNLGMNLGEAAGAGIAGHIHMHVLPRWRGDANFVSTVGETRVMPEELSSTYRNLLREFSL
ncbi:MAG: HIT domain-containing protein [Bryobacteraceae bacterium]|jgi:ATP adenylyltransferase